MNDLRRYIILKKDILVIGGSIGGCLAALTAAKLGKSVLLTEETDWIGGQLTSQAVPPDEHPWIEEFGCTKTYREFRNEVRRYYQNHYPLREDFIKNEYFNPGNAWVSRIAHEPKVSLKILKDFMQPYLSNGQIEILLHHKVSQAEVVDYEIQRIFIKNVRTGEEISVRANYYLDATELGDVLPVVGADYVVGAEAKEETMEAHALEQANPQDMQAITHVFALDYIEGANFTIEKPDLYDFWRHYRAPFLNHDQLSVFIPDPHTGESKKMPIFSDERGAGLWEYRRIIDKNQFEPGFFEGDISLINWPQNDYWLGPIIDVSEKEREENLEKAKQLSLSLLYWLQTEAPRKDGGKGYPGFRLRSDIVGTEDGLAKFPYIRESRRIKALHTVVEEDINAELREEAGIKKVPDSVGIGAYWMDLHPTTVHHRMFFAKSYPFEIPLGSFIPIQIKNLIPACKNIGTTQLTNGCFRVHHSEWNIGESAGALASFAIDQGKRLKEIYENETLVREFQNLLKTLGVSIHWPEVGAF